MNLHKREWAHSLLIFTLCQTSPSRVFWVKSRCLLFRRSVIFSYVVGTIIPQENILKTYVSYDHFWSRLSMCIKLGRRHWDACVGDLGLRDARRGTWGHQVWNAGTCGTETRDVKYRDAKTLMNIAKFGDKCDISFFVKMCYSLSTLDSIVQNQTGHLMMFTQDISSYRGKRTDYIVGKFTFANKIEAMYERSSVSVKVNFAQLYILPVIFSWRN